MDADIERAAHTLAETAGSPVRVILFGSHARGEACTGSDLDFLVIEPEVPDRHAEMVRLRSALHGMCRPIDVLVYSEAQVEEWGEAPGYSASRRALRGPGACRSVTNRTWPTRCSPRQAAMRLGCVRSRTSLTYLTTSPASTAYVDINITRVMRTPGLC